jgi:hypothetical protein
MSCTPPARGGAMPVHRGGLRRHLGCIRDFSETRPDIAKLAMPRLSPIQPVEDVAERRFQAVPSKNQ